METVDLELSITGLQEKLRKRIPRELREVDQPGFSYCVLSLAELFATKRAERLSQEVHALWKALNALEPQTIMTPGGYPYAKPPAVIFPLSEKCHAAVKNHGQDSPQHNAARNVLLAAMYDGMTVEEYTAVRIQRRRDAANVGFKKGAPCHTRLKDDY
jgi:hypothetical protein